jgi:hypothetical protein
VHPLRLVEGGLSFGQSVFSLTGERAEQSDGDGAYAEIRTLELSFGMWNFAAIRVW